MKKFETDKTTDLKSFILDFRVVKHPQEEHAMPPITSVVACTSGCITNDTCQSCTCAHGCVSDVNDCGTAYTC
jgi:hypothetical protein